MPSIPSTEQRSGRLESKFVVGVFGAAAIAAWWLAANRFFLSLDEGIYLAGAQRMVRGEVPYRDFFVLTGPISFWIEAAIFRLWGATLSHARLSLVADLGVLSAGVYWLACRLCGRRVALGTTFIFFAWETRPLFRLYVNHRWDSSALSLIAVALMFWATEQPRSGRLFSAGLLAALAAWVTPSVLALTAFLGLWLVLNKDLRQHWRPYAVGWAVCSLGLAGVLFFQGALGPMWHDLAWASAHYPEANRVPYGYGAIAPGGLRSIYAVASLKGVVTRSTGLLSVLIPPLLPLAVYFAWLFRRWRHVEFSRRERLATLLVIASFGLLLSTYPRWSADQLLFVAPIFYVLTAYLLNQFVNSKAARTLLFTAALALGAVSLTNAALQVDAQPEVDTRIGRIRAAPADQSLINFATRMIAPGQTLFVYPYLPVVYFLTGAQNPTRYSFLQPGMMDAQNNTEALRDLQADPPHWVFYFAFAPETYHGIWPGANPDALHGTPIDQFIRSHYRPVDALLHPVSNFYLLERIQP